MIHVAHQALNNLASAQAATEVMRAYIVPTMVTLISLATLFCTLFIVIGGFRYMTGSGNPEQLYQAKRVIKNAVVGLLLVIASATLTGILHNAYREPANGNGNALPDMSIMEPEQKEEDLGGVITGAIIGVFRKIIQTIAKPFITALDYFTDGTPMMADNPHVFSVWLVVVAIADAAFIIVVALLGFQVMSFQSLGFDELDLKQLLPQIAATFLLINSSIFVIDAIIGLSNVMIDAIKTSFSNMDIWNTLSGITEKSYGVGLAGLLIMAVFLILVVMLIVYYLGRLITLYVGAVLSPLVVLLWLLPAFKDFAITAFKTYLTAIFVLFVHVIILLLASTIFTGVLVGNNGVQPNTYMALLVGIATVIILLKTQGFMRDLSYAASTPRAARELGSQFIKGISSMKQTTKSVKGTFTRSTHQQTGLSSSPKKPGKQFTAPKQQQPATAKTDQTKIAERIKK